MLARVAEDAGVSSFAELKPLPTTVKLGLDGEWQRSNAALALHMCACMLGFDPSPSDGILPEPVVEGLTTCRWAGRAQQLSFKTSTTLFLDGAHSPGSLIAASKWFMGARDPSRPCHLVFNCSTDRNLVRHFVQMLFFYQRCIARGNHFVTPPPCCSHVAFMLSR